MEQNQETGDNLSNNLQNQDQEIQEDQIEQNQDNNLQNQEEIEAQNQQTEIQSEIEQKLNLQDQEVQQEKDLEKAKSYKEQGNKAFSDKEYDLAIDHYEEGLEFCPDEEIKLLSILNSNIAICYKEKKDWEALIQFASKAIELDPVFKKAYLNRSHAYEQSEQEDKALEDLQKAIEIDPNDKALKQKEAILKIKAEEAAEKKKKELLGGLKDLGNKFLGMFGMSVDNFKLNQNQNGSYNIQYEPKN